ncbi:hypothetical protein CCHR01_16354 [Colletotrichum chrysophilum]|uniref:Uncharacterized protein n=1 Tax=Colletotrichum chrysophilum TaxID=1836956 RepID=A0AAD9A8M4_9PEZI|nr:hypothetical protein CCHR01_16354 [Colletotrichum chrysophilum]
MAAMRVKDEQSSVRTVKQTSSDQRPTSLISLPSRRGEAIGTFVRRTSRQLMFFHCHASRICDQYLTKSPPRHHGERRYAAPDNSVASFACRPLQLEMERKALACTSSKLRWYAPAIRAYAPTWRDVEVQEERSSGPYLLPSAQIKPGRSSKPTSSENAAACYTVQQRLHSLPAFFFNIATEFVWSRHRLLFHREQPYRFEAGNRQQQKMVCTRLVLEPLHIRSSPAGKGHCIDRHLGVNSLLYEPCPLTISAFDNGITE